MYIVIQIYLRADFFAGRCWRGQDGKVGYPMVIAGVSWIAAAIEWLWNMDDGAGGVGALS